MKSIDGPAGAKLPDAGMLEALFTAAPIGIALHEATPPFRCIWHNSAALPLVDESLHRNGFQGIALGALFAPESTGDIERIFKGVCEAGAPLSIDEYQAIIPPDTTPRYFRFTVSPILIAESVESLLVMVLEISELVRSRDAAIANQEALRRREEEFRALVENSPEIIARLDGELCHLYVNPAIERVTGIPADHFIGRTDRETGLADPFANAWELTVRQVFETGRDQMVDFHFPGAARDRVFQARVAPEFALDGTVESVLVIARDVSESRRVEAEQAALYAELLQRERRLNELVERIILRRDDELDRMTTLSQLTAREQDVLRHLGHGYTNREIGAKMHISAGTVKNHVANILVKLNLRDRVQAAVEAARLGLLAQDS